MRELLICTVLLGDSANRIGEHSFEPISEITVTTAGRDSANHFGAYPVKFSRSEHLLACQGLKYREHAGHGDCSFEFIKSRNRVSIVHVRSPVIAGMPAVNAREGGRKPQSRSEEA